MENIKEYSELMKIAEKVYPDNMGGMDSKGVSRYRSGYVKGYQDCRQAQQDNWISVETELPPIDEDDNWNKKHGISKDVWTFSDFGMRKGRYFHNAGFWTVDNVTATNGVKVTHFQFLPKPPQQRTEDESSVATEEKSANK